MAKNTNDPQNPYTAPTTHSDGVQATRASTRSGWTVAASVAVQQVIAVGLSMLVLDHGETLSLVLAAAILYWIVVLTHISIGSSGWSRVAVKYGFLVLAASIYIVCSLSGLPASRPLDG